MQEELKFILIFRQVFYTRSQVVFLGWLENPAEKILGMNFCWMEVLEHGIMALEPIAGGVPVICPHEYLSSDHSPMKSIYAEFDENSTVWTN